MPGPVADVLPTSWWWYDDDDGWWGWWWWWRWWWWWWWCPALMLMPSPPPVHATAVNSKASWRASPAYVTSWGYVIPVCVARLKLILTRGHILACDTHWYAPRTRDLKTCPQDSIHASIQLEFNFIDNHLLVVPLWFNQSNLKYFQCQLVLRIWKKGQVQLYKCHQDKKFAHIVFDIYQISY